MAEIQQRAAIVTGGAGGGIGHGITTALAAHGWSVLIVDCDGKDARSLADALGASGARIEVFDADLRDAGAAAGAVGRALERFGRLDGLVNSAGVGLVKPVHLIEDEEFERLVDIDFRAVFRFSRASLPALIESRGAIVNIGSIHAHRTVAGYAAYAAIKAGIEAFTRGLAVDYGAQGVRANCIHPGLVESPQNRALLSRVTPDVDAWLDNYTAAKQLVPTLTTARDIGETAAFLLGAGAITGQAITIDGGSSAMLWERERGC